MVKIYLNIRIYKSLLSLVTATQVSETEAIYSTVVANQAETASVWEKVSAYTAMNEEAAASRMFWYNTGAGLPFAQKLLPSGQKLIESGAEGAAWTVVSARNRTCRI